MSENPKPWGSNFVVGADHNGQKIAQIYTKGVDYCIYRFEGHDGFRYSWSHVNKNKANSELLDRAIRRFELLVNKAQKRFKRVHIDTINSAEISALRSIFRANYESEIDQILADLDSEINDTPAVARTLGVSKDYCVWMNKENNVSYRIREGSEFEQVTAEYTRIKALAHALLPDKHLAPFYTRLGAALVVACKNKDRQNVADIFSPLESLLNELVQNELRTKLILITVALSAILIGVGLLVFYNIAMPNFLKLGTVAATAGVAGALISFLERSKKADIRINDLPVLTILGSTCRVGLGALFGVIAFSATEIGLAFSVFKGNSYGLLLLGVAAGFSERLIPDMLISIAKDTPSKESTV
ncbi:hypothetical protein [Pseudoduganella sp. OTU4001]|uniref:hypothetical protein n=1 Tax=Pseudoduganella sp. OTU4001 TaxID=3043854 RepID=UPI00313C9DE6